MEKNYLKPQVIEENEIERKMVFAQTVNVDPDPESGDFCGS